MPDIIINIHSKDGITTEINGVEAGKLIVERTPRFGVPGGMGFGGGEALCLAVGACFYNNLRREAASHGVALEVVEVEVTAVWDDDAPGAHELVIRPRIEAEAGPEEIEAMVQQALEISFVVNTLSHGARVRLSGISASVNDQQP